MRCVTSLIKRCICTEMEHGTWYGLKATVSRLAQDRGGSHFRDDDVDEEIRKRLDTARQHPGVFARVHVVPRSPGDVPDEDAVRLVVLGPEYSHDPKSEVSTARGAAERLLAERAGGARRCRNMLVFLAADAVALEDLRQAVRQWLAWSSIDRDRKTLVLDEFQIRQVDERVRETDDTVNLRIAATYQWVLTPAQPPADPTGPVGWEVIKVSGSDALAERVSKKLVAEESLIPAYSSTRLRLDMDRGPLWRGDDVQVSQLWDDYTQYLYLPRLVDRSVLDRAIEDGTSSMSWSTDSFAYADVREGERYIGIVAGSRPTAIAPSGFLVKSDVAQRQLAAERPESEAAGGSEPGAHDDPHPDRSGQFTPGRSGSDPARYYGRITLQSARSGPLGCRHRRSHRDAPRKGARFSGQDHLRSRSERTTGIRRRRSAHRDRECRDAEVRDERVRERVAEMRARRSSMRMPIRSMPGRSARWPCPRRCI